MLPAMAISKIVLPSQPFGDSDVDTEMKRLGLQQYSDVYLEDTQFSVHALDPSVYLISGRRGTGKTALSRYFKFQKQMPELEHIEVRDREAYPKVLANIAELLPKSPSVAIPELVDVWKIAIWNVIFDHFRDRLPVESTVASRIDSDHRPTDLLTRVFKWALRSLQDRKSDDEDELHAILDLKSLDTRILKIKRYAEGKLAQIVLSIDTVEKYNTEDHGLMMAVAALVQFAADFNLDHSPYVQVKVFLPGEIYTTLEEKVLLAPAKHLRRPLHLIWTPPDLLRLIMWRYWKFLFRTRASMRNNPVNVAWSRPDDVYKKMWRTHFEPKVSGSGRNETSLSYVLRHTQMRPR